MGLTMFLPIVLLGLVLATLYGAAFHFWRGGGVGRLVLFILLSLVGFWLGHWIVGAQGWNLLRVGTLQVGGGTFGSIIFLLIGNWLSQFQNKGRI